MKVQKCGQSPTEPVSARHLLVNTEPQELLESLRTKQKLYETLKTEGLIHKEGRPHLEQELKETIRELETLIGELEKK